MKEFMQKVKKGPDKRTGSSYEVAHGAMSIKMHPQFRDGESELGGTDDDRSADCAE